jgi:hypothetical protein
VIDFRSWLSWLRDAPARVRAVRSIALTEAGDAYVLFQPSHAYHYLRRNTPRFDQLISQLRDARVQRRFVAVTENDRHEILDVRGTHESRFAIGEPLTWADLEVSLDLSDLKTGLTEVTPDQANDLFHSMQARGKIGAPTEDWIPFVYPDDGCDARAHRMCELMATEHNVRAAKVWLYAKKPPLKVPTCNSVDCQVLWDYHVAPVVKVQVGSTTAPHVIDPSVGPARPLMVSEWIDEVNGPSNDPTIHAFTSSAAYERPLGGTARHDKSFSLTPDDLVDYQEALICNIKKFKKPPPYCVERQG